MFNKDAAKLGYNVGLRKEAVAGPFGVFLKRMGAQIGQMQRSGNSVRAKQLMDQARQAKTMYKQDPRAALSQLRTAAQRAGQPAQMGGGSNLARPIPAAQGQAALPAPAARATASTQPAQQPPGVNPRTARSDIRPEPKQLPAPAAQAIPEPVPTPAPVAAATGGALPGVVDALGGYTRKGLNWLDPELAKAVTSRIGDRRLGQVAGGLGLGTAGHFMLEDVDVPPEQLYA